MKGGTKMDKEMATAGSFSKMATFMRVISKMTKKMVKANSVGLMGANMKEVGLKI